VDGHGSTPAASSAALATTLKAATERAPTSLWPAQENGTVPASW
jgi:hypothetical protein